MVPGPATPRDLLWYQQMKREHQYLLERVSRNEADVKEEIVGLKKQLTGKETLNDSLGKANATLRNEVALMREERKQDLMREKDRHQKVVSIEATIGKMTQDLMHLSTNIKHAQQHQELIRLRVESLEKQPTPSMNELTSLRGRLAEVETAQRSIMHAMKAIDARFSVVPVEAISNKAQSGATHPSITMPTPNTLHEKQPDKSRSGAIRASDSGESPIDQWRVK
ncbi:hypothetical protein MBLNU459_g4637t1 [Dothideomycetes sp. NU459]